MAWTEKLTRFVLNNAGYRFQGTLYFRGGSRIVFRRGCTRLLLYLNTNKPHSFFSRIPVVLENRRSSQGGGGGGGPPPPPPPCTLPLHPPLYLACEEDLVKWQSRMSQARLHERVECIVERLVLLWQSSELKFPSAYVLTRQCTEITFYTSFLK